MPHTHTVSRSKTRQHGAPSSQGFEPTSFYLKDEFAPRRITSAAWRFRWQWHQNGCVSSPDSPTWQRESSCPVRRPCPAGWGCCPSSRSPSRTELLPPQDCPLWSAETPTDKKRRKKQWRPRCRTVTKRLQCTWRVTSVVYWISICMLRAFSLASGCKLLLSLKNNDAVRKHSLNVIKGKQHAFHVFTTQLHCHLAELV